jgi:hypothetical protein
LRGDDRLDEQDQGVNSITEAVKTEQFPVMRRESNLVDGLHGDTGLYTLA